ncbi:MAG: hypothetical protein FJ278_08640, partial [Planctomycetes bacterium]|nr:hypothetical protein [Planctomycetota bacterium]
MKTRSPDSLARMGMGSSSTILLSTAVLVAACWPALSVRSAETRHLAGVEHVSTIKLPHRWGVDFVKRGNYLYLTGSESQRKFAVIDASDPRNLKVVAENEAGLYAARNLCIHDNLILTNLYRYINAIDVSDPTQPELLLGCQWDVDPERQGPLPHYRFQWVGKHVFLACAKPQRAFRVYEVERLFLPKLVATVDLSSRLDEACVKVLSAAQQWYPNAEMLVDGATVHTSFGTHVVGFDVRNPAAPSVLYCHKMPANVVGLALAGKRLYVAMNSRWTKKGDPGQDASVAVVDLASPASLKILGEYRGMAVPERLLIAGDTLYLVGEEKMPPEAANLGGVPFTRGLKETFERRVALHVLDAANPARIVCRASLPFPLRVGHYGDAVCRAMALDGGVLFVADHDYGVRTVDVSDPGRPRLIGGLRTITHEVRKVIPAGKTLYIVNGSCVNAADISDPQRPLLDVEGSLSAIAGWTISQPVFHPNGRFLYSLKRGSYEVAVAEFQKRGAARGEVVNLVRLPDGWGGRDLGWARDRLFVLGTKENEWAKAELFVFQPVDGGKGLKLTARCPLGAFKSWVGWV